MIIPTNSKISTISDFLASSDRLSQICNHTEKIQELQIKLRNNLGGPLNEHVVVADYQKKTLVLHTDSAAWAARLRYLTPDILTTFKGDLPGVRTIRIKVVPPDPPVQTSRKAVKVSPDTAGGIREVADKIPDKALRTTLRNIAGYLGSE